MSDQPFEARRFNVKSKKASDKVLSDCAHEHGVILREHACGNPECGIAFDLLISQPRMEEHADSIMAVSEIPQSVVSSDRDRNA